MLFLSLILRPAMKNIPLNVEDIPSRDQKSSLYTKTSWFGWMTTYHSPALEYVKWKLKISLCNYVIILSFLKKVKDQRKWSIFQCFYFSNKIWEPVLLNEIKYSWVKLRFIYVWGTKICELATKLTSSLLITYIFLLIGRDYWYHFKCSYLKN